MADAEDIQPLVCDNGTGMVKDPESSGVRYMSASSNRATMSFLENCFGD